ncbi:MAG: hypothetical protein WCJ56_03920 [bacterium]
MKVTCPSCKREIPPEDINIQSAIAKCSACGEFFMLGNSQLGIAAPATKPQVAQPKGITIYRDMNALVIQRSWFDWYIVFMTFFAIIWDSITFSIVIGILSGDNKAAIFGLSLHIAAGCFISYIVLTGYFNRTIIRVRDRDISVQHGPFPWPGNKSVCTDNLQQIYCAQSNNNSFSMRGNNVAYEIHALYDNGRREKILAGVTRPEQARFIEQQLEAALGITDFAVAGEMGAV